MKILSKILIVISFFLAACDPSSPKQTKNIGEAGFRLSAIKLTSLNGKVFDLGKLKGKTVFLNFWATWCGPCLQEMPAIKNAMKELKDENIVFIFASEEDTDQIEDFSKSHDYGFDFFRIQNLAELNIVALPTTFIFNENGALVFNEMGYRKWDDKENIDLIKKLSK